MDDDLMREQKEGDAKRADELIRKFKGATLLMLGERNESQLRELAMDMQMLVHDVEKSWWSTLFSSLIKSVEEVSFGLIQVGQQDDNLMAVRRTVDFDVDRVLLGLRVIHGAPINSKLRMIAGNARQVIMGLQLQVQTARQESTRQYEQTERLCVANTELGQYSVELLGERSKLAKALIDTREQVRDHACAQCLPEGGPLVVAGFECAWHLAESVMAKVGEVTPEDEARELMNNELAREGLVP